MAQAVRAQALMFLGHGKEAHEIFLRYRGRDVGPDSWQATILKDFEAHRKAGRSHALMTEIERLFGKPVVTAPSALVVADDTNLADADDVESGTKLFSMGRLREALVVYLRN